jgi:hypothetical protein
VIESLDPSPGTPDTAIRRPASKVTGRRQTPANRANLG